MTRVPLSLLTFAGQVNKPTGAVAARTPDNRLREVTSSNLSLGRVCNHHVVLLGFESVASPRAALLQDVVTCSSAIARKMTQRVDAYSHSYWRRVTKSSYVGRGREFTRCKCSQQHYLAQG